MRYFRALLVILLAATGSGCLVHIERVANGAERFAAALDEAQRHQGRSGPAREINVLVYDPDDHEMVRVSLPVWLANRVASHVDVDDIDIDPDNEDEVRLARAVRRSFKDGELRDLSKLPLGILAQVDSSDGERVLVWMR